MNREDNYYYNGSGYADPTAAAVINKITKESKMNIEPKPFEIWHNNIGQTILVLAVAEGSMQFTRVYGLPNYRPGELSIGGDYVNPRFIAYNFADKCKDFVRILTDAEVEKVKSAIASVFGITMGDDSDEVYELKQELRDRDAELSELRKMLDATSDVALNVNTGSPDTSELEKKISSQQLVMDLLIEKLAEARCGKE